MLVGIAWGVPRVGDPPSESYSSATRGAMGGRGGKGEVKGEELEGIKVEGGEDDSMR